MLKTAESEGVSTLISVDRSIKPVYPKWMRSVLHLELEATGKASYDLAQVDLWLHEGQKDGKLIAGSHIYERLEANHNKMLKECLSLLDAEEIKKKGVEVFHRFFKDNAVFCWKSVLVHQNGYLLAPCIAADADNVVVLWVWLGKIKWSELDPAGRLLS